MAVERRGLGLCQVDESKLHPEREGGGPWLRTIAATSSGDHESVDIGGDNGDNGDNHKGGAAEAEGTEAEAEADAVSEGGAGTGAGAGADVASTDAAATSIYGPSVILAGSSLQPGGFVAAVVTATGASVAYPHALAQVTSYRAKRCIV